MASPNNQLADRCEKATGPDRNIDLAIAVLLNRDDIFDAHYTWRWGSGGDEIEAWEEDARMPSGYLDPSQFCPRVTASLDAAMTLIEGERPIVILHAAIDACGVEAQLFANRDEIFVKRLPLFVCAAALRARQS